MKPIHSLYPVNEKRSVERSRREFRHPLIDYFYLSYPVGGGQPSDRWKSAPLPALNNASYTSFRREARRNYIAETSFFVVIAAAVVYAFVVCGGQLFGLLQLMAAS